MRRTLRFTVRFFQLSILILIVGIVTSVWISHSGSQSAAMILIAILGCTWGGIGVLVCPWLYWIYRGAARRADQILAGTNRLAHWTCSADEWDRFLVTLTQRSRKVLRLLLIIFPIVGAAMLCAALFPLMQKGAANARTITMILSIMLGVVVGLFLLLWFVAVYLPVRLLRHPSSREVFIGTGGLVAAGKFQSWEMLGSRIKFVRYEPADPGTLLFRWTQAGPGVYGVPSIGESTVPVPKSNDADARRVVEFFTDQFQRNK
jgi:hypothetical protein